MSEKKSERREFLFTASYAVGAVGVGAVVWPLVDQMNPDASVKALASTEVDVSSVKLGKTITVLWRGKPVFIKRRTPEEIAEARAVKMRILIWRLIRPQNHPAIMDLTGCVSNIALCLKSRFQRLIFQLNFWASHWQHQ